MSYDCIVAAVSRAAAHALQIALREGRERAERTGEARQPPGDLEFQIAAGELRRSSEY
jgi:hypothetical protein